MGVGITIANKKKKLNPFFCRVGSKRTLINKILPLIPQHTIYVEPFIGGGAVYFAKEPSDNEIINDLDETLIMGYNLLKNINNVESINKVINKIKTLKNEKDKLLFQNDFIKIKSKDNGIKLYQILLHLCNSFSSTGKGKIYKAETQDTKINKIADYKERLKNTKILSMDYKDIIKKFDSVNTFFFLDPPYEKSKGLYHSHSIDYNLMYDILSKIKGKFLLTINDSPEILNIFKNFKIKKINVKGIGNEGKDIGGTIRKELIITNY